MSGFLNKKERLIDYKLTEHGRKQLSLGELKFKYYTFSDRSIVYQCKFEDGIKFSTLESSLNSTPEHSFFPFEATTDPGLYYNPEYYLSSELKFENTNEEFFGLNSSYKTLAENISSSEILLTRTVTNKNLSEISDFNFSSMEVKKSYDFGNSILTRKYPTVKFFEENIENIKSVKDDARFLEFLRYKKMPPIGITNSLEVQNQQAEDRKISNLQKIFKSLRINNKINRQDTLSSAVVKAVDAISNTDYIHKLLYELNPSFSSEDDVLHFEVHNIVNENNIDKLSFVKLGSFYDEKNKKFIDVFLVGKFYENLRVEEDFNVENNTTFVESLKDFKFINIFTLVVEKW